MTGRIRMFAADRGFGFIEAEGRRTSFFFHVSDFADAEHFELKEGDRVSFDEIVPQPAKGPRAMNVVLVGGR